MKIAIFGASSQIAKDLIRSFVESDKHELILFARKPEAIAAWLKKIGVNKSITAAGYMEFKLNENFDVVMNFVGVGNPAVATAMGASIFDVTQKYDELAISYLKQTPTCRYIFLSSGAAYGSNFDKNATEKTVALIPINNLHSQDWYGVAKLYAECRHRSLPHLPIIDIRVFNYFSHNQDMDSRFFVTDIVRSILEKRVLEVSKDNIFRDIIGPKDFYQLIKSILNSPAQNDVIDCYTKAPIDKEKLLRIISARFGLKYRFIEDGSLINATGYKKNYYSGNRRAENYGYKPNFSSIETIIIEIEQILKNA